MDLKDRRIDEFNYIEEGDRFVIEVEYSDPKYDYSMYKNSYKGLIAPIPGIPIANFYSNITNC